MGVCRIYIPLLLIHTLFVVFSFCIDPTDFMSMDPNSPKNPLQVAQNIWDLFLGGTSQYRPFGASVVDGIDLHIWNNNNIGVNLLATTLRNLMGDQYLLTS